MARAAWMVASPRGLQVVVAHVHRRAPTEHGERLEVPGEERLLALGSECPSLHYGLMGADATLIGD